MALSLGDKQGGEAPSSSDSTSQDREEGGGDPSAPSGDPSGGGGENVFASAAKSSQKSSEEGDLKGNPESEEKPSISGKDDDPFRHFKDEPGSVGEPPSGEKDGSKEETSKEDSSEEPSSEQSPGESYREEASAHLEPSEELFEFLTTYRFTREDLGFTAEEVYKNRVDEGDEPDEFEEDILEQMIFEGAFTKEFSMGEKYTFVLATHGPDATRNCMSILKEEQTEDDSGMDTMYNTMMVARSLVQIQGRKTCEAEVGNPSFEKRDAIRDRFEFCKGLPQPILDAIGSRVNMFLQRTSKATMRDLSNF